MSDANKWITSTRVSLDELDKLCKWQRNQRVQLLVQVDDLEKEVKRLREVLKSIINDIIPPQHEGQTQVELTYKLIEPFMKEAKEND